MNYWTRKELLALESVKSMDNLAEIAITILARMSKQKKPIVQICGPMSTGGFYNLSKNMRIFEHIISKAENAGHLVFNQIPFQKSIIKICNFKEDFTVYPIEILEIFYKKIFKSGFISKTLFIPDYKSFKGYKSSKGASWEYELCKKEKICAEICPIEWLHDFKEST